VAERVAAEVSHQPHSLRRGRAGDLFPSVSQWGEAGRGRRTVVRASKPSMLAKHRRLNARRTHRTPRLPAPHLRLFSSSSRASHNPFHRTDPSQFLARRYRLGGAPPPAIGAANLACRNRTSRRISPPAIRPATPYLQRRHTDRSTSRTPHEASPRERDAPSQANVATLW